MLQPFCCPVLDICVVWLGYKLKPDLFYLCFESSAIGKKKYPSWDAEASTEYTRPGASPGPGAQVAHHQTEKYITSKSPLQRKKDKREVLVLVEGYPVERRHPHPYLQGHRNTNITVLGTKSKQPKAQNSNIAWVLYIFLSKIHHLLKRNKRSHKSVFD